MSPSSKSARISRRWLAATACAIVIAASQPAPIVLAASPSEDLAAGFVSPPPSAKPHTWWHWMNGNITKEGITADLEAMQRVGIGGVQIFNVLESIPDGAVDYLSPKWLELFHHAVAEADRLGLEVCFQNCAGWSSSGGPWITPEHAMQMVVTSETKAKGPSHFDAVLPQPPTNLGFYRDIAVVAFPTPSQDARVEQLATKALKGFAMSYGMTPDPKQIPAAAAIPRDKLVELTKSLKPDGRLTWDVPQGDWTILRVGRTPTGKENHPAPKPGRGLECDKLSREALDLHWAAGIEPILKHVGPLAGKTLNNCLIDSYEVGNNNWSPNFREEFIKRRGYDPISYLPTLTGRYVDDGERTERFLWDFRRTIGDLFAENYFNHFAELCHKRGLLASAEPYDGPFECLQVGTKMDIIMGEFWVGNGIDMLHSVKLASSVANTHGISIVGAESFTALPDDNGRWLTHPGLLKMQGDAMWCGGINRFIFHTYAHQPWKDKAPGMTMGQWGTHFSRTNTWWEQSHAWMTYIARAQYLLQQGRTVADVLYFGGEASPNGGIRLPSLKAQGYEYDVIGTDLMMALSVKDGLIQTPVGGCYRLLVLPSTDWMTPALAKKVRDLVEAGATVLGPKPTRSPSLANYPACDGELRKIADEVWGAKPGEHVFGKGKVITGKTVEDVLAAQKITPDFTAVGGKASLDFIHRVVEKTDIYFVSNQKRSPLTVECSFRVSGRWPELWNPETGDIQPAPMWRVEDGRTIVTLDFEQAGSTFVVFRRPAHARHDPIVKLSRSSGDVLRKTSKLEIKRAFYGDFSRPDGKKVDVTAKLAERVRDGELEISADNSIAGDPAINVAKELRVDYVLDGVEHSITSAEGQTLRLPSELIVDAIPVPRLSFENGVLYLTAGEADRYTVTTASGATRTARIENLPKPFEPSGSWEVTFPEGLGAPAKEVFYSLISWTDHPDPGIKYFSGTAAYHKTINVSADYLDENRSLVLDLGRVREIAEVWLNGQNLGVLWKAPFRIDITGAAKVGDNELEVRVTNLWPNRLIGDEQQPDDCQWDKTHFKDWPDWMKRSEPRPAKQRVAFTTWKHWAKDSPLRPSGLLGPVRLLTLEKVPVK